MFKQKWLLIFTVILVLLLAACSGGPAQPETAPAQSSQTAATPAPAVTTEAKTEATEAPKATEASAPAAPSSSASGGTVRIGWNGSPDSLNPGAAWLAEAFTIFEVTYDTMFDLQLDGSYKLTLADSYDVAKDGKTWTFKIKQGIKFHDGQPMTAKDIAFTYNFYKTHTDFPYLSAYGASFASIEAPDDSTVVIKLTEPVPNMEYLLVFQYILPQHIWSKYDTDKAAEFENLEMVGTGPFKMVEYKQNEFVHLAANKDYFGGAPKVDEVVFQTFANADALVQALTTGQVDAITEMPNTAVPTLRNAENVKLVTGVPFSASIRDIAFNQVSPENCPEGSKCSGHPALRDRNVRLALAYATDKQKIIDVAELGLANPGLTLIPDSLGTWYNNTLQDYPFDIAKANQILDEAGYKDKDGDGVRDMPDGSRPLTFRLYWPNDVSSAPRTADLLKETWSQIGVKLEPQAFDPDALTTACCPDLDYDIYIWGWGSDPDPNALLKVYTTDDIATGNNETGYSNPKYDELFKQQGVELDAEKRRQIIWEMQKIVLDDVVYIIPYYQQQVQAYRTDRFAGWIIDQPKLAIEDVTSLQVITPVQ